MSHILFNIGLSLLSRNENRGENRKNIAGRKTALAMLSHFDERPVTEDDILREESERPYFPGKDDRDFNISHSADMVAVSYVRTENGKTGLSTGCDVQLIKERVNTLQIAEHFFSPAENEYIKAQKENNIDSFFEIWSLKECYIKLTGLSVFDMRSAPEFINKEGELKLIQNDSSFFLYKINDANGRQYILAAAVKGDAAIPQIKWFSEPCVLTKLV